jgi:uncharacterized protein (DUF983 family)
VNWAVCPHCGAPLIGTLAFAKYEWYCLECGRHYGYLEPKVGADTPGLAMRAESLQAEWDREIRGKLIPERGYLNNCQACAAHLDYHMDHASDTQLAAHQIAFLYLEGRKSVSA